MWVAVVNESTDLTPGGKEFPAAGVGKLEVVASFTWTAMLRPDGSELYVTMSVGKPWCAPGTTFRFAGGTMVGGGGGGGGGGGRVSLSFTLTVTDSRVIPEYFVSALVTPCLMVTDSSA